MTESIIGMSALADELEAFIRSAVPGCEGVKKYGGTLFTLRPQEKEGQFCGVFVHTRHVQISFSRGAELNDSGGVLQGSGKRRRHLNFKSTADVDFDALEALLDQAAKL